MTAPLTWVVGRGGLLGRHVEAASGGVELWRPREALTWGSRNAAAALAREARAFFARASGTDAAWRLFWCAGAGVVATSPEALAAETEVLREFFASLASGVAADRTLAARGTVFLASSAGGVYAGSPAAPPYNEESPVAAIAPYGLAKLEQEAIAVATADAAGFDLLVGRLSNLYGEGQNLSKPQGLIAHVGRAALLRQAISIYVPLDTIRDYLFAPDAARMIVDAVERRERHREDGGDPAVTAKIFASEVETTVAAVLATWRRVLKRPLHISLSSSPVGRLQPRVLSFRSCVWPELRGIPLPLLLGLDAVRRDQLARLLAAGLR